MSRWWRWSALLAVELLLLGGAYARHSALERGARPIVLACDGYWMGRDFGGGYAAVMMNYDWELPRRVDSDLGESGQCWIIFEPASPTWSPVDVRERKTGGRHPSIAPNQIALEGSYGGTIVTLAGNPRLRLDERDYNELQAILNRRAELEQKAHPAERKRPRANAEAAPALPSNSVRPFCSVEARIHDGRVLSLRRLTTEDRVFAP